MAKLAQPANDPKDSPQMQTGELRDVARQPILDLRSKVHGYELLFWNGREPVFRAEDDQAARALLDSAVLFGLEKLTYGVPAFINCTADSLTEEWVSVLPPKMTVLELHLDAEPAPDLIAACQRLKALGFRLALDDFDGKPELKPLVDLANYIKVDFAKRDAAERQTLLRGLKDTQAQLVAENVETQEAYRHASSEGFKLFQGYYFCRPEPLKHYKIPANRLVHLEILEVLQQDPVDLHRLSQLVICDASLTYRLLRLVNSPICAVRQEVTSIQAALVLLGEKTARRIATLAIASDFNSDQPTEVLRMAFVRGRFCELAASLCGQIPTEQYLIGMVSLFPAMMHVLMEDLINSLPLREPASDALLGKQNPEGCLLHWLMCYENGNWSGCDAIAQAHNLPHDRLMSCYTEAVTWADTSLNSAV
jgi:EAL and modified HD-GYP domain-containing signal transduction protein